MTRWTPLLGMLMVFAPGIFAQELKDDSFDKLFSSVVPTARESAWRKVPWHATSWRAHRCSDSGYS